MPSAPSGVGGRFRYARIETMKNNLEQYNSFYAKSDSHTYGKPADFLEKIYELVPTGLVLDLGGGDGRYAIPMAKKGYDVTVVDTSEIALQKLHKFAEAAGVELEAEQADLSTWQIDKAYDAILGIVIFQHLQKPDAWRLLGEMKEKTKPGGVNAFVYFTNEGDRYILDKDEDPDAFYPSNDWHKEFYADWDEVYFKQKEAPLINKFHENGEQMVSTIQTLIVQKSL